jgi:bis(5'-nucleosyl)-tetraphosphatase (symmetrical)
MALYLIGDLQGCDDALQRLLDEISFSPSRDTLYLLGDLVNRGPASAAVLRRLMGYGNAAHCLLGNHDLHLLALASGVRQPLRIDTVDDILHASDRPALVDWLRQQKMAMQAHGCLMVHAGVLPSWTAEQTMALAGEVETVLRGPDLETFLREMYGDESRQWNDALTGAERLRVIVNALTRLRYCTPDGVMEFKTKESVGNAPEGHVPWFDAPGRKTADITVAFGHWSTLKPMDRPNLLALDTGCVWGGCLSAWRLPSGTAPGALVQVECPQAQKPGPNA